MHLTSTVLKEFVRDRKEKDTTHVPRVKMDLRCISTWGNACSSQVTDRSWSQQRRWPGRDVGRGERIKKVLASIQHLPGARYCSDNATSQVLVLCQSWEVVAVTVSQRGRRLGSSVTLFRSCRGSVARWTCQTPCPLISAVLPKEWTALRTVCIVLYGCCYLLSWTQTLHC